MSVKLMSQVWETGLPSARKMILLCLADFANDDGKCWPSIKTVARKCGVSERHARRAVKQLSEDGYLERIERDGKAYIYKLNPCRGVTPDTVSPLTHSPQTPDTVSPKPSENHHCISKDMLENARELWNDIAGKCDWPAVRKFTPSRNAKLKARLAEHGEDGWRQALTRAAASAWLGHDPPKWFTFDFLVRNSDNILKVLEGNYDQRFSEKRSAWID